MTDYLRHWHGWLTVDNVGEVAERISAILSGRRYTFVACNEFFGFEPEVRTGQRLTPEETAGGRAVTHYREESAGFNVHDSYGSWGCYTTATGKGRSKPETDADAPYIVCEHDRIKIRHRAPSGSRLYWVAAVEHPDDE